MTNPKWDEVLNQLTEKETEELFLHGYVKTEELENIGKPLAREADGPAQIGSFNQNQQEPDFPMPVLWPSHGIQNYP